MTPWVGSAAAALAIVLAVALPGLAQQPAPAEAERGVEFKIEAPPPPPPPPPTRDQTRTREGDFYPEDVRTLHRPAFIEPLTTTIAGRKFGVSGWTAPPGRGDLTVQRETTGWLAIGVTWILDAPEEPAPGVLTPPKPR